MVARLGYREVATHYGCAYTNDEYRVMEERAERVPGVTYKESRCAGRPVVYDGEDVTGIDILTNRFPEPSYFIDKVSSTMSLSKYLHNI
jgi:hypothetical protein